MSTLTLNTEPIATDVAFDDAFFRITLDDGRELSVPIDWFPRLRKASVEERNNGVSSAAVLVFIGRMSTKISRFLA